MKVKSFDMICYVLMPLVYLEQGNFRKSKKLTKIVNTNEENLQGKFVL